MTAPRFAAVVAGIVLMLACGRGGEALVDGAMTRGYAPPPGVDAAANRGVASVCTDVQIDPHNCGSCGHDCLGGLCSAGACLPVALAAGIKLPGGLAIDDTNVYWTDPAVGQIKKMAKAGGLSVVVTSASPMGPIAVDSGKVYWIESYGGRIGTVPVEGGTPSFLAAGLTSPQFIAADAGEVYVADFTERTVRRLTGSPAVVLTGQFVEGMAFDAANLYCATAEGNIIKVPRGGGNTQTLAASTATLPDSGLPEYGAFGVAVDTANVYWTYLVRSDLEDAGKVLSAPIDGGIPTVLCAECEGAIPIAVDRSGIYWAEVYLGNIVTLRGGSPTVLASGQESPLVIATDDTSIYWLNYGSMSASHGAAVMRLAK